MDFDFSDEQQELRGHIRRYLGDRCPSSAVRAVLDGKDAYDRALYAGLADMGFLGAAIPERWGGVGLGYLELCVLAEELGRVNAPVPVSSSLYLAAEFLLRAGTDAQRSQWLPRLASGSAIGTLASVECGGTLSPAAMELRATAGRLTGRKIAVPDGGIADFAIVAARDDGAEAPRISLYLVDLSQTRVSRQKVETIDPTRGHANLEFDDAEAEPLGRDGDGWSILTAVFDRAAVLFAFEQVGGADRALEMARDYALERMAFGRPIGSFQAVKHLLADMYVAATLARSNAYYGAWALSTESEDLPLAAATARVSATKAFRLCSKNSLHAHGGLGFTWEYDSHLFYRRANALGLVLGSQAHWEELLVARLPRRSCAAEC